MKFNLLILGFLLLFLVGYLLVDVVLKVLENIDLFFVNM